jgi:hypothetical protein
MEGDTFVLQGLTYGSFTRRGAREALLDLYGCEPHANNYGGSVLLRVRTPAEAGGGQGWARCATREGCARPTA